MTDQCQEQVSDGGRWPSFHTCGRPIKRDGLCGLHAAAKDRAAQRDRDMAAKRDGQKRAKASAEAALTELGVKGRAAYDSIAAAYTGEVVVSVDELRRLMARADA
jgi:hypothetical protein